MQGVPGPGLFWPLPGSIITDASPWGLGGYLMVSSTVIAYFSSAVTQEDESILKLEICDAAGQQTLEALSVLVALRLWRNYRKPGASLRIRSDNVSTLTLLVKLQPKCSSQGMSIVARELAPPATNHGFFSISPASATIGLICSADCTNLTNGWIYQSRC